MAAGKRRTSTHHAIELLRHQHREIEARIAQYTQAASNDEKQALFECLADSVAAHNKVEEEIFYPEVLDDANEDDLREAVEEHLAMKRIIADLLRMGAGEQQFDAKVQLLGELILHHFEKEEEGLFATIAGLEEDALLEMGARMKWLHDELMDHSPRNEVLFEIGYAAPL